MMATPSTPLIAETTNMTSEPAAPRYRRAVLKLSGESFARAGERGICMEEVVDIAQQVHSAQQLGCQLAIVIGGGNILRGAQFTSGNAGIQEATAHYMGMLATVINGLALQDALESLGCETRLMTAIRMDGVAEPYIRRRARRHLEKGRIIILAAGTGSPFVTTDTAAPNERWRSKPRSCSRPPASTESTATIRKRTRTRCSTGQLDYTTVRERNLRVMDHTAIAQCMEHKMPILVFNFQETKATSLAVRGEPVRRCRQRPRSAVA